MATIELLSKEKIKPSSSTPQHLHIHNLSLLDQRAPPTYVDLIFFYESPKSFIPDFDPSQIPQNLKKSLSDVLTSFYPLAGRIKSNHVLCNDDGVDYVQTRVHASILEVTESPNPNKMQKYVSNIGPFVSDTPLSIQVNFFDCGGVAVGVRIAHKIADIASMVMFVNAWSATCRKDVKNDVHDPSFDDLSCHFPPMISSTSPISPPPGDDDDKNDVVLVKRFVFDKEMLLALKKIGTSSKVTNPSKIEVATAFIWRSFMMAHKARNDTNNTNFLAFHAVNARSKVDPSLIPAHSFGNGCMQAIAWCKNGNEDEQVQLPVLTAKLRNAIRMIDGEYVMNKIKNGGEDEYFEYEGEGFVEACVFSSWCKFGAYEVDFGWGKPHWVSTTAVPFKNLTVFIDTKCGDGIEAWVTMAEADMALIETNYKQIIQLIS
ncbi:hypothetical protein DH2020_007961 [Rehmannia glutinosa]|uniref:Vinorine synthase n=1 Tax=Rehmannia glutinosa TaxID=99300 RepID=A0ABR0U0B6_REHGL